MASLLEKKSVLWTLIGLAAVVLIIIIGSVIASSSPRTLVGPPAAPAEPTNEPTPAPPAPAPVSSADQAPTIDANLKAAGDALSDYAAQSGDLNANALDSRSSDLNEAALKLSP